MQKAQFMSIKINVGSECLVKTKNGSLVRKFENYCLISSSKAHNCAAAWRAHLNVAVKFWDVGMNQVDDSVSLVLHSRGVTYKYIYYNLLQYKGKS
jgi:hypothetical protein